MGKTVYTNGNIITMDSRFPKTEAVLVEGGRIRACGEKGELLQDKGHIRVFDLRGATLMPAFIDSHSHITALAQTLGCVTLAGAKSFHDIVERIQRFRKEKRIPDGEWIVGFGYDQNHLQEGGHPTREVLDQALSANPVVISHVSGHMGVMNTAALRAVGIGLHTPDPEGGKIGRSPDGQPTGYLEEKAFTLYSARQPEIPWEQRKKGMQDAQELYLRYGITTVQDLFTRAPEFETLRRTAEEGALQLDVVSYVDLKDSQGIVKRNPQYVKQYHNRLKIGGYKVILDGSPQGRTAWLTQPYEGGREKGYGSYPLQQVQDMVRQALGEDMQLLVHCNGDAAAEQMVTAFRMSYPSFGTRVSHTRPVMIHAQMATRDQLQQMAQMGILASFFVAHTYYWGDIHTKNLGWERAQRISPIRTAIEQGAIYTLHQDTPVIPPDMLMTMWCAVMRLTQKGMVIGERERISPLEALRGVTSNAAYQYFEEGQKGSITPGKRADFVILDQNPLMVPLRQIRDIQVLHTIKDGEVLYSKYHS